MCKEQSADLNPNPIMQVTATGDLHYFNTPAKKLIERLGFTMDQFNRVLPPDYQEVAQNCLLAETSIPATQMLLGGRFTLWSSFFYENNTMIEFYGMDVTRMVRVEQSLRESKQKAEEGEKLKAAFLDNMSHEIRTPLNSLLGFMTLLQDELSESLTEDQRFYFDLISQNGNRLERTMREILDISHFSSGTYQSKTREFNLYQIMKEIFEEKQRDASAKNLEIKFNFSEKDLLIKTDVYCLTQALTHLIDNAVKYTEVGEIHIAVEVAQNQVEIQIEDTGPGMDDEAQRRIFVPFNQGSMGHTKQFQGIGLGLSLVRVYIDSIGANIDLDSELGEGSRFKISIPL